MSIIRFRLCSGALARQRGALSNGAVIGLAVAAVVLLAAAFFLLRSAPDTAPVPGAAPDTTAAERGDTARDLIARLQSTPGDGGLDEAYEQAVKFRQADQLADTQLLLFFAARGGHAPAAFDLATLYDPNRFSASASVLTEADAFQAYKWYTQAREAGHAGAQARLDALRSWAEQAARGGNQEADRLLLQWR